jgi:transcriptional regulator with XRE-family HTH domain
MTAESPDAPGAGHVLRVAREAQGLSIPAVAARTGISKASISVIELGYQVRQGGRKVTVTGKASTVARIAASLGVSESQLAGAGRPDAAEVLREIRRREQAAAAGADDPLGDLRPQCSFERHIIETPGPPEDVKRAMIMAHRAEGHRVWCVGDKEQADTGVSVASLQA